MAEAPFHPTDTLRLREMPAQPPVHQPEDRDDGKRQQDEVEGEDRVGDERVERLVGNVVRVIERIAFLPPCREAGEEDQRRGMRQIACSRSSEKRLRISHRFGRE